MRFARRLARAALILALACPASAFAVGHERIPLDHWSYLALERFESLGLCVLPDDRPFTRDEIIAIVERIEAAADVSALSARDGYELDRLQREFIAAEARDNPGARYDQVWYGRDRAIALEGDLLLRPYLQQQNFSTETEAFVGLTPEFRAHLGDRFTYDVRYQLLYGPEHGDRARNEKPSRREKSFKGLTSLFERSYVVGAWDQFEVFFGRDYVDWGPSAGGNLITPGPNFSIDQINARLKYKALRLDFFYGQLWTDPQRWMVGHRLEAALGRTVLGLSETVVYGGRPLDWMYALPVAWYYANQFNERTNSDNVIWSVDAKTSVLRPVTLYGSLLIDDYQFEDQGYPNKLAADIGARWVPAKPWGLEVRGQYRWADIYTYSHEESLSVYVSGAGELNNGDVLLGGQPGPDADSWFVNADTYPRANWRATLGAFGGRIGDGNDLRSFHLHVDDPNPAFPAGVVQKSIGLLVATRYELSGNSYIAGAYSHVKADNRARLAGNNDTSDGFKLEIGLEIP
jgi:Capsule assembly protein Wzi